MSLVNEIYILIIEFFRCKDTFNIYKLHYVL